MTRTSARLYRRRIAAFALASALALGVHADAPSSVGAQPVPFSTLRAGASVAPWTLVTIAFGKRHTRYELADDAGRTVLHAVADSAASALAYPMRAGLRDTPVMTWRWKIAGVLDDADSREAAREDAPARIVLEFDGDRHRLPLVERSIDAVAHRIAGHELPYATLMYIWSNREPVGTVIANPHTRRVQMIVASTGADGVGEWQSLARDVRADYRLAFGEEPGPLIAVGVMTDSDNTRAYAEAWYGDIRFERPLH